MHTADSQNNDFQWIHQSLGPAVLARWIGEKVDIEGVTCRKRTHESAREGCELKPNRVAQENARSSSPRASPLPAFVDRPNWPGAA